MMQLSEQYGVTRQPDTMYWCDDSEDLKDIKNPPMGTKAYIIHEKRIVIADSSGKFCDM